MPTEATKPAFLPNFTPVTKPVWSECVSENVWAKDQSYQSKTEGGQLKVATQYLWRSSEGATAYTDRPLQKASKQRTSWVCLTMSLWFRKSTKEELLTGRQSQPQLGRFPFGQSRETVPGVHTGGIWYRAWHIRWWLRLTMTHKSDSLIPSSLPQLQNTSSW